MAAQCLANLGAGFLLTRPAAASARFAEALRESFGPDARIVISPLMQPEFLHPVLPVGPFDALILTSEIGAEAARRLSADGVALPGQAVCVGDRTAQAAEAAGFQAVTAKGDAAALVRLIATQTPGARYLHLRGQDTTGQIAQQLDSIGISTAEAVVYCQQPQPLTRQAAALLSGPDPVVVPLFSPRSADLLAAFGPFRAPLWIAALSPAVAERSQAMHPARLAVATLPDARALLRATESLCAAASRT